MGFALPPSHQDSPFAMSLFQLGTSSSTTITSSVFDQTTNNLIKVGCLSIERFAQDPSEEVEGFDIPLPDQTNPNPAGAVGVDNVAGMNEISGEIPNVAPSEAVRCLREVALREFGATTSDPLRYEFLDDPGQDRMSCILTIMRPNGVSRSYRTKAEFTRKMDAKMEAASQAIKLGALHFIKHGEGQNSNGKRGLILAKLDAPTKKEDGENSSLKQIETEEQDDSAVAQIETCCIQWRVGSVIPKWIHLIDPKIPDAHGYALKISLSSNIQRAYSVSVSTQYPKRSTAKAACARSALEQGVIEFIKHGDGLETPIEVPIAGVEALAPPPPTSATSLIGFYAALPKPLPDHIGVRASGEINAVGWLNTIAQLAKGSRMTITYSWYTDARLGLHGCLLRLSRPDEATSRTYLVDAIFSKRSEAKIAVCLLACSQGVGNYFREIAAEVDSRVTPEMRRRAAEQILPALGQALNRFKHGSRPDFTYDCEASTFSCTLTTDLSTDPDEPIKKQWEVPLAYKSKLDARIAVVCLAADDGLIDFIRNRGKNPVHQGGELEEGETTEAARHKSKKDKKFNAAEGADKAEEGELDEVALLNKVRNSRKAERVFETREEALAKGRFSSGLKRYPPFSNGRGRGAGFFDRRGYRAASGLDSYHRSSRESSGFSSRPAPYPQSYPSGPRSFHHSRDNAPVLAYDAGYPPKEYGMDHDPSDRDRFGYSRSESGAAYSRHVHGHGAAGASFAHPPSPPRPRVAPGYQGYHNRTQEYDYRAERDYRPGQYSSSEGGPQYEHEYSTNFHPPPSNVYQQNEKYGTGRDDYGARATHNEHGYRAPDYDRIPDHRTKAYSSLRPPPHAPIYQSRFPSYSHSHRSGTHIDRRIPTEPRRARALYNHLSAHSTLGTVRDGDTMYEHTSHGEKPLAVPSQHQSPVFEYRQSPAAQTRIQQELNCVTPRLEDEANDKLDSTGSSNDQYAYEERRDNELSGNDSRHLETSFLLSNQGPSKRERSPDWEDLDAKSFKRARIDSQSVSEHDDPGNARERQLEETTVANAITVSEDQGMAGRDTLPIPTSAGDGDGEGPTLRSEGSLAKGRRMGDDQKKSHVTALFDYCEKLGISCPVLCHEEVPRDSDKEERTYKVWFIMDKEKLELSTTFKSLITGQERVAKSVLGRLREQMKERMEVQP